MGDITEMSMNGHGVYYNNTAGSKYTGQFKDDAPHGIGKEEWKDGTKYEGQFKVGVKDGRGTFQTTEGSVYEGEFKDGAFDGQGQLTSASKTKFIGLWKSAELQSPAEIVYEDGRVYKGEINKEMKPHGKGVIESATKKYTGVFKNGSLNGQVTTHFVQTGESKKSLYKNGVFVEWLDDQTAAFEKIGSNVIDKSVSEARKLAESKKGTAINNPANSQISGSMANPTTPSLLPHTGDRTPNAKDQKGQLTDQDQKTKAGKKFICC